MAMMPTPYSILKKSQDENPLDPTQWVDVFAEIFSGDDFETAKCAVMWGMYHDTGIGNDDLEYWERCMTYKNIELVAAGWDARIAAQLDLMTKIQNDGPDYTQSELQSESLNQVYDPPEVATAGTTATNYLADQTKTGFHQYSKNGLETETVRAWSEEMPESLRDWAREFRKLFYWGL